MLCWGTFASASSSVVQIRFTSPLVGSSMNTCSDTLLVFKLEFHCAFRCSCINVIQGIWGRCITGVICSWTGWEGLKCSREKKHSFMFFKHRFVVVGVGDGDLDLDLGFPDLGSPRLARFCCGVISNLNSGPIILNKCTLVMSPRGFHKFPWRF